MDNSVPVSYENQPVSPPPSPSNAVPQQNQPAQPDDMSNHRIHRHRKVLGISIGTLLLFAIILSALVVTFGKRPINVFERQYAGDAVAAKVGEETLYYADVAAKSKADDYAVFSKEDRTKYINSSSNIVRAYLEKTIEDSVLLQEGKVLNILTDLSSDVFNNKKKDYKKRQQLVSDVIKGVNRNMEMVDVDVLTLYYTNDTSSSSAKKAMDDFRLQIANGTLTFAKAGENIASDTALVTMSQLNKNSYVGYKDLSRNKILFKNQTLQNQLFTQRVNTISPVTPLLHTARNPITGSYESKTIGYIFFRPIKHIQGDPRSYTNWLADVKSKYSIERK